jgi:hypothetical protein
MLQAADQSDTMAARKGVAMSRVAVLFVAVLVAGCTGGTPAQQGTRTTDRDVHPVSETVPRKEGPFTKKEVEDSLRGASPATLHELYGPPVEKEEIDPATSVHYNGFAYWHYKLMIKDKDGNVKETRAKMRVGSGRVMGVTWLD